MVLWQRMGQCVLNAWLRLQWRPFINHIGRIYIRCCMYESKSINYRKVLTAIQCNLSWHTLSQDVVREREKKKNDKWCPIILQMYSLHVTLRQLFDILKWIEMEAQTNNQIIKIIKWIKEKKHQQTTTSDRNPTGNQLHERYVVKREDRDRANNGKKIGKLRKNEIDMAFCWIK